MKKALIAVLAAAALTMPAAAQQQPDTNQKAMPDQQPGGGSAAMHLSRSQTKMLQQELNKSGLNAGPVDGVMGTRTRQALQKYQSQKGLNASGQVDRQTLAALLQGRVTARASNKNSGSGGASQPQNQPQQSSQ
jgi:peptidoglycan hydrolase-like protein with peptidoglycan-binding domain